MACHRDVTAAHFMSALIADQNPRKYVSVLLIGSDSAVVIDNSLYVMIHLIRNQTRTIIFIATITTGVFLVAQYTVFKVLDTHAYSVSLPHVVYGLGKSLFPMEVLNTIQHRGCLVRKN